MTEKAEHKWPREFRAYTCLTGCFFLMFNSWGLVNAFGTYASFYKQHLLPGKDLMLMNLIGSTQCFMVLSLSAIAGRLLDADYGRGLIGVGTIMVPLGWVLLSVVNGEGGYNQGNYGLIWVCQGLISGFGMACFFVASSKIASTYFTKVRGIAIGIVASGASIAGLVYPVMTKELIKVYGFNRAAQGVGALIFATSLVAFFLAVPAPGHPVRKIDHWVRLDTWMDTHALQNKSFRWLVAGVAFMFFGFYAVFFDLEEWAEAKGIGYRDPSPSQSPAEAGPPPTGNAIRTFWLLSTMNASSTIGRIVSGAFGDKFGALNLHSLTTFVSGFLVLVYWTQTTTVSLALGFVVVFGIFSGAVIGMPPASVANILEIYYSSQAALGQWTGIMYTAAAIPALVGPVIAGHLISEYRTFLTVQGWSGTCLLLAAICMGMGALELRRVNARAQQANLGKIGDESGVSGSESNVDEFGIEK